MKINLIILSILLINGISYAGTNDSSLIVVGGNHGTIVTSPDGVHWTVQKEGVPKQVANLSINSMIHNTDNSYTALAVYGEDRASLTSKDGINWTVKSTSSSDWDPFAALTWDIDKKQFLALHDAAIYTSPNGWNWTRRFSGYPDRYESIAISDSTPKIYLAAGGAGGPVSCVGFAITSTDGINWSKILNQPSCIMDVVWAKNQFVASAQKGGYDQNFEAGVLTSRDGKTWEWNPIQNGQGKSISKIIWANNMYVALGRDDKQHGHASLIYTSPDGVHWTATPIGINSEFTNIAWINNMYVIIGIYGVIATSLDAMHWTLQNSGTDEFLWSIA